METINGLHDTNWYITNTCDPNGDHYWCGVSNMQAELRNRCGLWMGLDALSYGFARVR